MESTDKYSIEPLLWWRRWTAKLFSFRLRRPPTFRFVPGQFVRLGLPRDDGSLIWRPYSMVSATYDDYLEFYSIEVPEGEFTSRLARLTVGDALAVDRNPWGHLTTDRFHDGDALWLLATGTGLAPFLSILQDPAVWRQYRHVVLVHSVREGAELAYQEWLADLPHHPLVGSQASRLRYQPVVTREDWPHSLSQRIPQLIRSGTLEVALGLPLEHDSSRFMVCGNPEMVEETRLALAERGFLLSKRGQPGQVAVENSF